MSLLAHLEMAFVVSQMGFILAVLKQHVCALEHTFSYFLAAWMDAGSATPATSRARTMKRFGAGPT